MWSWGLGQGYSVAGAMIAPSFFCESMLYDLRSACEWPRVNPFESNTVFSPGLRQSYFVVRWLSVLNHRHHTVFVNMTICVYHS